MNNKLPRPDQALQTPNSCLALIKQNLKQLKSFPSENRAAGPIIEVLPTTDRDFKVLLNNIPAVVFRGYIDGSVDFFDHKIEEMTGYPRNDFESRQRKWTELIIEEDIAGVKEIFIQALKNSKSYVREYRIRDRQAKILWVQERSQIISDKKGKFQYVSGIFFDITAQKETAEAIQEGERFLSSVFASTIDGISILDLNFTIVQVNPIMEKWYAHDLPLVGKKCYRGLSRQVQTL